MKPERNDPCPCGSGKKYKKCCGAAATGGASSPVVTGLFQQARQALASGDFHGAEECCRQLLLQTPRHPDANHVCGIVSYRLGLFGEAKARLALAAESQPDNAHLHSNFSLVWRDSGELAAAAVSARRALALDPGLAAAHGNLATIQIAQGDYAAAILSSGNAIRLEPNNALFHATQADAQLHQGEVNLAEAGYRHALELAPQFIPALAGLGALCVQQKHWVEARDWLTQALHADTSDPLVFNNLGLALFRLHDTNAAVDCYKQALARKPDLGGAHYNLGMALEVLGKDSAVDAYAAAMHYGYAGWEVFDALCRIALRFGQVDRVYAHALQWLQDENCPHEVLPSIIAVFGQACDFAARDRAWKKFLDLYRAGRVDNETVKILLGTSLYPASLGEETVWELHRSFGAALEAALADRRYSEYRVSGHDRKLRIGYLSPDLRRHSVGFFIQPVIAYHDPDQFEIFCYSLLPDSDEVTDSIRQHATRFVQAHTLDDAALAQRIHDDGIHLLIDLAGYSMHNRVEVLARKPAPLQLTWIGYLHALGLETVDYRITDIHADDLTMAPDRGRLLVLPECFLCFGSFPECERAPVSPVVQKGHVTFASFNNLTKITSEAVRVWSRILAEVSGSRLWVMSTDAASQAVRQNLLAEFAGQGIATDRIVLRHPLPQPEYLRVHNEVDIILDTWPFNGGTVTASALWMGVPVVTLAGPAHRQRVGYSLLKNSGVEDTVAWNEEDYIAKAVALAGDPARLTALRQAIADGIRKSVLCDPRRFTRQLEAALQQAWGRQAGK